MSSLVKGLGGVFVLMGLWIVVFPDQLVSIADWESRQGLYVAAGMRVVIGLVLILAGPSTRLDMTPLIIVLCLSRHALVSGSSYPMLRPWRSRARGEVSTRAPTSRCRSTSCLLILG